MGSILDELGKKLADRWFQLLILPGALYLVVGIGACTLGQSRPFDIHWLTTQVIAWAKTPAATTVGGQVVLLAAALAGAAAAGLAAQALGTLIEMLTLAAGWRTWKPPLRQLAARRVDDRLRRWDTQHAIYSRLYWLAVDDDRESAKRTERHAAYGARTRVAPERPERPTWSGDRVNAVNVRLKRDLHLNLPTIWAALWLTLPDPARTEITAARQALANATTMIAWAVLYLILAALWWPAALIAIVVAVAGWHRTRLSADAYASLLEAGTRLYARDLARHLGIDHAQPLDRQAGDSITATLHSEPPPAPKP
jgi:hypothetical protein